MKFDSDLMEKLLQKITISETIRILKGSSDNFRDFVLCSIKGQATRELIRYELENYEFDSMEISQALMSMKKAVEDIRDSGEVPEK